VVRSPGPEERLGIPARVSAQGAHWIARGVRGGAGPTQAGSPGNQQAGGIGRTRGLSNRAKVAAIVVGVLLVAVATYWALADNNLPRGGLPSPDPATCPLTGEEPKRQAALSRPAVAMKIENAPVAYPLSGLERADIVYEELVEGGITRFMAIYHCSDTAKAGPIRSARLVDPAIMKPGHPHPRLLRRANGAVLEELVRNDIVMVIEANANDAMQRVPREGLGIEHTLYADSARVRRVGGKEFDDPPASELGFGDLEGNSKRARTITIIFSSSTTVTYEWNGKRWARSQGGNPFETESYGQIGVDNVIVEAHTIRLSNIVDVTGTPLHRDRRRDRLGPRSTVPRLTGHRGEVDARER
jgi:hypothetical protein